MLRVLLPGSIRPSCIAVYSCVSCVQCAVYVPTNHQETTNQPQPTTNQPIVDVCGKGPTHPESYRVVLKVTLWVICYIAL